MVVNVTANIVVSSLLRFVDKIICQSLTVASFKVHCQNQEKICNNIITKDPTTPQVFRYTTL